MKGIIRFAAISICLAFLLCTTALAQDEAGKDLVFQGKIYCSQAQHEALPFAATITEIPAHVGQQVKKGDVLVRYTLSENEVTKLRRQLSKRPLIDMDLRLAQVQSELVTLRPQYNETKQLVEQNMASDQKQQVLAQRINLLERQYSALKEERDIVEQDLEEDLDNLRDYLGEDLSLENIPETGVLTAPMDGHLLWIDTDIRPGAELKAGPGCLVGVMSPMLIRARLFESEVSLLAVGDEAQVKVDSLPQKTFQGVVTRLSWSTVSPGLDQPSYYEVELEVPNPEFVIKDGYKAQVYFSK